MESTMNNHIILVINCGSSSLKYQVYEMPRENSLGSGIVERIGEKTGSLSQNSVNGQIKSEGEIPDHKKAMELIAEALADSANGILESVEQIKGIGHRVVHGGEEYSKSVLIDDVVIKIIDKNSELAPLHNPAHLMGIDAAKVMLPGCKQVAVFDTAFHQTISPASYLYGIPYELYEKYKIRRYGFHGTSHRYVAGEAVKLMKRSLSNTNVISCHLGNGASITAISQGRSVETSMGFTPLSGLVMGTRCGDIDPAILLYLGERGYSPEELNNMLNKKSGLLGLSGISNDLRDLEKAAEEGDRRAQQALDVYAHQIRLYIGAYTANIVRADILVFTGGIGQHGTRMRERICHRLEGLGVFMDYRSNLEVGSKKGIISEPYSPTSICVVPTNEELQIAKDTYNLIFGKEKVEE
jgi:acetate kinase